MNLGEHGEDAESGAVMYHVVAGRGRMGSGGWFVGRSSAHGLRIVADVKMEHQRQGGARPHRQRSHRVETTDGTTLKELQAAANADDVLESTGRRPNIARPAARQIAGCVREPGQLRQFRPLSLSRRTFDCDD